MNENINLCEILKDTPKGTMLYSSLLGEVEFEKIKYDRIYVKHNETGVWNFNSKGHYLENKKDAECILFPSKEQRDWSKYHRPFIDGDVISNEICICIYNGKKIGNYCGYYVGISHIDYLFIDIQKENYFINENARLATEEEKEKLFQAIKDKGYKWNPETKNLEKIKTCLNCKVFEDMHQNCQYSSIWTCSDLNVAKSRLNDEANCQFWIEILKIKPLEKIIEPKFKVGDRIKHKLTDKIYTVLFALSNENGEIVYDVGVTNEIGKSFNIKYQDEYELVEYQKNQTLFTTN